MRRRSDVSTGKFHAMMVLVAGFGAVLAAQPLLSSQGEPLPVPAATVPAELDSRIRALQLEAERLTAEADSLVAELRRLEQARDRRRREAQEADRAAEAARARLAATTVSLGAIEAQRSAQRPELQAQLVDLYKRGRGRHARVLVRASSLRDLARARRAVTALVAIGQQRLDEHRHLVVALEQEREQREQTTRESEALEQEAARAQVTAERALEAHRGLVARIESQRDLNRQYVRELQVVYERLVDDVTRSDRVPVPAPAVAEPLTRGRLRWPVAGTVTGRFGETAGRLGGSAVRNGIELAAAEHTPVVAAQGGTVSFAGDYIGFGTLLVLSHGGEAYSLYGYLGGLQVSPGQVVAAGTPIGQVGRSPAGPPALYFELRVDGQSVDPVQWLEPRDVPVLPGASR
jgi:murein hydrolase activator